MGMGSGWGWEGVGVAPSLPQDVAPVGARPHPNLSLSSVSSSGAEGPPGPQQRPWPLQHPMGISAEQGTGTGAVPEAATDPDMEALFEEFLGKGNA